MALHIDIPTQAQIAALLDVREPACVSIYLPTSPLPQDAEAAQIEFKNLAAEAVRQVEELEPARGVAAALKEHFEDLSDDEDFWAYLATSLAVLATPERVRTFRLPNRLTTLVEVSDRFHLKPLLRSVTFPQAAFVLALAQGSVRLIEIASDVPAEEVPVHELPDEIAGAVGKAPTTGRLSGAEGQKVRMRQYARQIDRALRPVLAGAGLPLILAAAEPLDAIYRSVNGYPHLAATSIAGNPETTSAAELAEAARPILDALYAAELAELRERFEARASHGRGATDLTDVARAATFGAVETLMTDIDDVIPGFVAPDSGAVTLDAEDVAVNYGVVDEIARRVWLSGGRVLALRREDIPEQATVAAILRYPV